jgi:HEAT repeat protein
VLVSMDLNRLEQLEADLRQGRLDRRKAALDELAQSPAEEAIPILQRLTLSSDFLCRRFAVMGLGNHRTPAAFGVLQELLEQETDNNVVAEIADALFGFGPVAIPLLQQLFLRNSHWLTRQTILSVLMEAEQDQVLLDVIRTALTDETQTVRETAILALGVILKGELAPQALDILSQLAESDVWRDRWRAATALNLATDPRAQQLLAKLQQDENHYVVAAALEASLPPNL